MGELDGKKGKLFLLINRSLSNNSIEYDWQFY
jgi:hypothetical protein